MNYNEYKQALGNKADLITSLLEEMEKIALDYQLTAYDNNDEGERIEALIIREKLAQFERPLRHLNREIGNIGEMEN